MIFNISWDKGRWAMASPLTSLIPPLAEISALWNTLAAVSTLCCRCQRSTWQIHQWNHCKAYVYPGEALNKRIIQVSCSWGTTCTEGRQSSFSVNKQWSSWCFTIFNLWINTEEINLAFWHTLSMLPLEVVLLDFSWRPWDGSPKGSALKMNPSSPDVIWDWVRSLGCWTTVIHSSATSVIQEVLCTQFEEDLEITLFPISPISFHQWQLLQNQEKTYPTILLFHVAEGPLFHKPRTCWALAACDAV